MGDLLDLLTDIVFDREDIDFLSLDKTLNLPSVLLAITLQPRQLIVVLKLQLRYLFVNRLQIGLLPDNMEQLVDLLNVCLAVELCLEIVGELLKF